MPSHPHPHPTTASLCTSRSSCLANWYSATVASRVINPRGVQADIRHGNDAHFDRRFDRLHAVPYATPPTKVV